MALKAPVFKRHTHFTPVCLTVISQTFDALRTQYTCPIVIEKVHK